MPIGSRLGIYSSGQAQPTALGGTIQDIGGYRIHTFLSNDNLVVSGGSLSVDFLIVGGGGGTAGGEGSAGSSGGGAGGYYYQTGQSVSSGSYPVVVGAGGLAGAINSPGNQGGNSSFNSFVSIGGGAGGRRELAGGNGGSGGGAGISGASTSVGLGTVGQGNNGGANSTSAPNYGGGGGGGAGSVGGAGTSTAGGNGGTGLTSSISGSLSAYAGGGGAGFYSGGGSLGVGGYGGGAGGQHGIDGTGGGAGGAATSNVFGGTGGSGIIIIRYPYIPDETIDPSAVVYLDARKITQTDQTDVTTWNDRTTSNNDAISSANPSPYYDIGGLNGFPSVHFDVGDHLVVNQNASVNNLSNITIFFVARYISGGTFFSKAPDSEARPYLAQPGSATTYWITGYPNQFRTISHGSITSNIHVFVFRRSGAALQMSVSVDNGTFVYGSSTNFTDSLSDWSIGRRLGGFGPGSFELGEMQIWNKFASDVEVGDEIKRINTRWGTSF